jgi:hypothetical protein
MKNKRNRSHKESVRTVLMLIERMIFLYTPGRSVQMKLGRCERKARLSGPLTFHRTCYELNSPIHTLLTTRCLSLRSSHSVTLLLVYCHLLAKLHRDW